ncbi:hydrolase [Myroides sp. N17-2]|uniref:hydrolase n=1 Tax=Myroides sp. N17-2 TaxID=2030799 RepID=UPI000EFCFF8F|nr:hydrolase [Myroides sp. N17-2]
MKHKAFFYLFLFSSVLLVLFYANNNNMYKMEEKKIDIAHKRIDIVRDSLKQVTKEFNESNYFSIEYNNDAQEYFNYKNIDKSLALIKEEVLALNHQENGNPLVPYGVMNGDKCVINKVKILNHRWIIADFYAGSLHGEVLIKYFYKEGTPTDFKTIDTVLYTTTE